MRKSLFATTLITAVLVFTGCTSAPVLSDAQGQEKTDLFLQTVSTDASTAYTETSDRFQSTTTVDDFKKLIDGSKLKDYNSFSLTQISYQQGVGVNAAKVDGDIVYTDLSKQNASFIWSYDNSKKDWVLDAFRFN